MSNLSSISEVSPLILSLDTATAVRSVAIVRGGRLLALVQGRVQKEHASSILSEIDEALAESGFKLAEVELLAVATGPGSFTGLRSGLATIKAFAATLRRPVAGVPTLSAVASASGTLSSRVLASLPAGRGEVFAQLLSIGVGGKVEELSQPLHVRPVSLQAKALEWGRRLRWAGAGAHAHAAALREFAGEHRISWREEQAGEEAAGAGEAEVCWTLAPQVEAYAPQVAALGWEKYRAGGATNAADLRASYVRLSDAELKERCLG